MTDNRTTELRVKRLRELIDERGIEHYDHENGEPLRVLEKAEEPATSWRVDGASYCAVPDGKGTFDVWIDHCTPEQAIAATLGSGMLTAEQVRDAIERHSAWVIGNNRCFHDGAYEEIADELNAKLGSDASAARLAERLRSIAVEMRNVGASSMTPHELLAFYAREVDKVADSLKFAATLGNGTCRNEWAEFGKFRCSECWTQVDAISTNTTQPMPIRYCPNCGAKAVD